MAQPELFVCPVCKEWTTKEENCCGAFNKGNNSASEAEILAKYKRVKRLANKQFGPELGPDVAQECALKLCEGKNPRQHDYYSIVDAVRSSSLRTYNRGGRITKPIFASQLTHDSDTFFEERLRANHESNDGYQERIFNLIKAISLLKNPKHIEVTILISIYGHTLFEVSKLFGVTESRVSQIHSASKESLKKIFISQGLLPRKQREVQQTKPQCVSSEIQVIESLSGQALRDLEEIQRQKNLRESELAARAFFKIPKAVFSFNRKTKETNQRAPSPMAKIKLEGKSFICPKMEKKTIKFWTQKSN